MRKDFNFSNKNLILEEKEKCDKSHLRDIESDILVIFRDDTGVITRMNDSNKPILPKYLHAEIKNIEDFHDVLVYFITKETLDTRLQLLKGNIRLSHLSQHSSEYNILLPFWNIILEYYNIFTLPGNPLTD